MGQQIFRERIFQVLSLLFLLFLCSCSLEPVVPQKEKGIRKFSQQKVFFAPYDSVWRAAQLSLKYPIALNNMDNGVLETDFVKAEDGFISPTNGRIPSSGVRYRITLVLAKGRVDGKDSVRVTISKVIERKRDFFSEPEPLSSDGFEEIAIFYRIERELAIDEALKKAAKAESSAPRD